MSADSAPLVSVVMATHDIPVEFLSQSIESIQSQSFTDLEFIIVSDAPEADEINRLLMQYSSADKRIRVYRNSEACGFPRSINRAISKARGDYVVRMDADDISLPERLQLQVNFMEQNPHIGISGMQAKVIDKSSQAIGKMLKPCSPDSVVAYLRHASPLIHPTYIVKREIYEQLGGYREFSPGQDYEFLIRANRIGIQIANQPTFGIKYRVNEDSLSHRSLKRTMKMGQIMRRLVRNPRANFSDFNQIALDKDSTYLRKIYMLRNFFIRHSREGSALRRFCMIAAASTASLHPDLWRDSYHGVKGARIIKREHVSVD